MIHNAYLYKDEINKLYMEHWYDPTFKFYFGQNIHYCIDWADNDTRHEFVSIDSEGNILGHIGYYISPDSHNAQNFGLVNFTNKPNITFTRDVLKCIDDIFMEFNCHSMIWSVTRGNPAEQLYDRFVFNHNGSVIGTYKDDVCLYGTYYDTKVYQVMRDEYLLSR